VVDSHTAIVPGEGLIATAGLVDSHVHASSPQIVPAALSSGITTVVAMGVGGVWDVGANPVYNLRAMMAGWAGIPLNVAFLARGSTRSAGLLEAAVEAGAGGFKVHEDWGATPAQIDACLTVAEAAGLPVALHTDTLNESGYLADTVAATAGRTVHAYHVEGGGGHPDVLEILNHASPGARPAPVPGRPGSPSRGCWARSSAAWATPRGRCRPSSWRRRCWPTGRCGRPGRPESATCRSRARAA
jgi:urease subunit alpha